MEFIDKSGHIFYLPSYDIKPIGYEYENFDYTFWVDSEYTKDLSTDNYYIKCIKILYKSDFNIEDINISVESDVFSFIPSSLISSKVQTNGLNGIELEETDFKKELSLEDITFINIKDDNDTTENVLIIPVYIICKSAVDGAFKTNILIKINDEYCPISVGGIFYSASDRMEINAANQGVVFPKDIVKSVYQHSFYNDTFDATLYNDKLKEYLLNLMDIRGNCGNTESAINSLKWFGWGDKIELYKLIKTDNEFQDQFIRDYLTIDDDNIFAFKYFKSTPIISLSVKENTVTNNRTGYNVNNEFFGEDKPITEDLFSKIISVKTDRNGLVYYKSYYDFTMNEIMLKLSLLSFYYKKYFLPLHITLQSASVTRQEFMDDIKFTIRPFESYTSPLVDLTKQSDIRVKFNSINRYIIRSNINNVTINKEDFLFDSNYLEMNEYNTNNNYKDYSNFNLHYISNELYTKIPIKIISDTFNTINTVIFITDKYNNVVYESRFIYTTKDEIKNLIFVPNSFILNLDSNIRDNYNWLDNEYILSVCCNGKWFEHKFTIALPELNISLGKLQYQYSPLFKQYYNYPELLPVENNLLDTWWVNTPLIYMFNKDLVAVNQINLEPSIKKLIIQKSDIKVSEEQTLTNIWDELLLDEQQYYRNNSKVIDNYIEKYYSSQVDIKDVDFDNIINPDSLKYINRVLYYDIKNIDTLLSKLQGITSVQQLCGLLNLYFTQYIKMNYDVLYKHYDLFVMCGDKIEINNPVNNLKSNLWLVFISKDTLNNYIEDNKIIRSIYDYKEDFIIDNDLFDIDVVSNPEYFGFVDESVLESNNESYRNVLTTLKSMFEGTDISFKFTSAANRFLINRMTVVDNTELVEINYKMSEELSNSFNKNDIIVAALNNIDTPVILNENFDCKWTFEPYSFSAYNTDNKFVKYVRSSKSNIMVLPPKNILNILSDGYYDIYCHYTLDGYNSDKVKYNSRIFIKK